MQDNKDKDEQLFICFKNHMKEVPLYYRWLVPLEAMGLTIIVMMFLIYIFKGLY